MSDGVAAIRVAVEPLSAAAIATLPLAPAVAALLQEIEAALAQLQTDDRETTIDLGRGIPLLPVHYQQLQHHLGRGEVSAQLDSLGQSELFETAIAAVWWIRHYAPDGALIAELITISRCPTLLQTPREELAAARLALQMVTQSIEPFR